MNALLKCWYYPHFRAKPRKKFENRAGLYDLQPFVGFDSVLFCFPPRRGCENIRITIRAKIFEADSNVVTAITLKQVDVFEKRIGPEYDNRGLVIRIPLNNKDPRVRLDFTVSEKYAEDLTEDADTKNREYFYFVPEYLKKLEGNLIINDFDVRYTVNYPDLPAMVHH